MPQPTEFVKVAKDGVEASVTWASFQAVWEARGFVWVDKPKPKKKKADDDE